MVEQKFKILNESDRDYFINKVKGALMYMGGGFEGKDLHNINAYDLIDSCFKNSIQLDCKIQIKQESPYGLQ